MTTPVSHGYPDYGRFTAQADVMYVQEAGTVSPGPTTRGAYFVGNVPAIGFKFLVTAGSAQVIVEWFDAATSGHLLALEQYEFQTGVSCNLTIPVAGPYVFLSILDGGAGMTFDLTLWASPTRRTFPSGAGGVNLVNAINSPIGIGVTATNNASEIHVGPAYWAGWQGVANFVVFLEAVDALGAVTTLDRWQGAGVDFWRSVFLPPARCRIRHVNQSGGATSYTSVLLRQPFTAGS